jgi:hypothetical protein
LVQKPPQHSKLLAQTSPFCVQNDPPPQRPALQSFEQHSAPVVHALLVVRQVGFRGTQTPSLAQFPLQHCDELVQAWWSVVHCDEPHTPLSHTNVQQSCGMVQEPPADLHWPGTVQTFVTVSQLTVQQSELLLHVIPAVRQVPVPPAPAPPPAVPALPPAPSGPPPEPPVPVSAEASPVDPPAPPVLTSLASGDPASRPAEPLAPLAPLAPPEPPAPVVSSDEPHPRGAPKSALVTTKTTPVIVLFTLFTLTSVGSGPCPRNALLARDYTLDLEKPRASGSSNSGTVGRGELTLAQKSEGLSSHM